MGVASGYLKLSIDINSGVLSDETLGKVLKDIENHLKKTNKELM